MTIKDSTDLHSYVAAIIESNGKKAFSKEDTRKLHDWLEARVKTDSLIVIYRE